MIAGLRRAPFPASRSFIGWFERDAAGNGWQFVASQAPNARHGAHIHAVAAPVRHNSRPTLTLWTLAVLRQHVASIVVSAIRQLYTQQSLHTNNPSGTAFLISADSMNRWVRRKASSGAFERNERQGSTHGVLTIIRLSKQVPGLLILARRSTTAVTEGSSE
ncbi:hypothetical protein DAEQUDRAFT_348361 [Daedalea quercina L-15889]|uniref:Uncharacterized protein n=1 Tax=Daedalea quercina L-15889 TaxID=1314783 RepID=A0A165PD70_9APHY|nr:hypothetical protein DAEQUDRAFT_348361 [Daedalea quercina L-15889]